MKSSTFPYQESGNTGWEIHFETKKQSQKIDFSYFSAWDGAGL